MSKGPDPLLTELRLIRRAQKLSQEALGATLGKAANVITEYETGVHSPRIETVSKWADTLGLRLVLIPK